MKLAFALPHTLELPAMTAGWEFAVTGPQQAAMVRGADELGYDMVSVPEHFVVPHSHLGLSGPHYLHSTVAQAFIAGATRRIRVNSSVTILPLHHPVVLAKASGTNRVTLARSRDRQSNLAGPLRWSAACRAHAAGTPRGAASATPSPNGPPLAAGVQPASTSRARHRRRAPRQPSGLGRRLMADGD
jgi:hypothetical protein